MTSKAAAQRLKEIDDQRAKLELERIDIEEVLKAEALAAVQAAIGRLVELGYNYRLAGSGKRRSTAGKPLRGPSRTGIRDEVLRVVAKAGPKGVRVGEVRMALNISEADASGTQAVANALFALKRSLKIKNHKGTYRIT